MEYSFAILVGVAVAIAAAQLWRMRRFGGWAAAGFGARIQATTGEVEAWQDGSTSKIRVHVLADVPASKAIGIEIAGTGPLDFSTLSMTLSKGDAARLAQLLDQAAGTPR